eukprot:1186117-Prorocentrum_minimum.AAC.7
MHIDRRLRTAEPRGLLRVRWGSLCYFQGHAGALLPGFPQRQDLALPRGVLLVRTPASSPASPQHAIPNHLHAPLVIVRTLSV